MGGCKRKYLKQVFSVHTLILVLKLGGKFTLCNTTIVKVNLKMNLRMMRYGVKKIPERYILKRWRKDVISRNYCFSFHESDSGDRENVNLVNDSYYSFESCLDIKEFESDYTSGGLKSKMDGEVVCKLMSVSIPIPKAINIHVPQVQSIKGSGIKKRIPSVGEAKYSKSIGNSNLPIFNFFNQPSIKGMFDPNMKKIVIDVET
uniref:Uncharacterized protein n=1 Tax=Lactuca sativa TaxID=4236 RepID=A0A9R1UUF1_LACSA|nr:hypothetical protein LSAT_V11C800391140 [Lactuca sativa]